MDSEQADKVATFSQMTGANPSTAQATLESTNWNLEEAANLFFAAADGEPGHDVDDAFGADEPANQPTSSNPQPPTQSSSRGSSQAPRRIPGQGPRAVTLRDLQRGGDESDDDEEDKKQDMFAGGEKSGLAVQNPDKGGGPVDHFKNIMNQARQNRERPPVEGEEEERPQRSSNFSGRAQTLGGDDAPSQVVEDPLARTGRPAVLPRATRTLHLWADGISIDDGPLFRFDDPANQDIMAQINQGKAPLSLLNVQPNQEVDLNLDPHKDENYKQPKPKYKPFSGQGQRLGSPTPGASSAQAGAPSRPSAPASSSTSSAPTVAVDENAPTLRMQVRLGDGTRLQSRFNTSHTVGDVYDFVNRASPTQRNYALMTTFPNKEYTDKSVVLGELDEFKRGGVLVQKWS
ncbi:UBX domain-containing protein 1-like [Teratosphaeria destructans]|uniref:UBX domain-containing protein 1-like n=1 Tax=Teratosphaeria destructans TaxID=418781 RepID=A0A9W7SHZ8_9PEZI|nr:UBX domain-containing protein 1-like [Teratosphaeria destructans]